MHKFYSEMTASVNYFNYNSQGVCERKMVSYDQSSMLQALTSTQTQRTPALMHSNTICTIYISLNYIKQLHCIALFDSHRIFIIKLMPIRQSEITVMHNQLQDYDSECLISFHSAILQCNISTLTVQQAWIRHSYAVCTKHHLLSARTVDYRKTGYQILVMRTCGISSIEASAPVTVLVDCTHHENSADSRRRGSD